MQTKFPRILLPILLLLCLTLPHLDQGEFRRDTVRYAAVGHHMFAEGDLVAPELRPGVPYFNKPPLTLWLHGATLHLTGVSLAAARLPSIFAAAGVVLLSMLCVYRLATRSEAVVSGFALVLTYEFFRRTREISLDLWQLLFLMGAAYCVVRSLRHARVPLGHYVGAGACVGLALLCKPLIGLAAFVVFPIWLLIAGQRDRILPMLAIGIPVALAVALPWHLEMWARFGQAFTDQYFGNQIVDRARGAHGSEGALFYLTMSEWSSYPWVAAGLAVGIYLRRRSRRGGDRDLVLFGLTWALPFVIGLSIFADKKPNYALLVWPMLSWVVAYGLCRLRIPLFSRWHQTGYRWLAPTAVGVALIVAMSPVKIQDGKQTELAQVFGYLDQNGVEREAVIAHRLAPNDYCYLYLMSGGRAWPKDRGEAGSDYIVSREKSRDGAKRKLRVGKYYVWKQRRTEGFHQHATATASASAAGRSALPGVPTGR